MNKLNYVLITLIFCIAGAWLFNKFGTKTISPEGGSSLHYVAMREKEDLKKTRDEFAGQIANIEEYFNKVKHVIASLKSMDLKQYSNIDANNAESKVSDFISVLELNRAMLYRGYQRTYSSNQNELEKLFDNIYYSYDALSYNNFQTLYHFAKYKDSLVKANPTGNLQSESIEKMKDTALIRSKLLSLENNLEKEIMNLTTLKSGLIEKQSDISNSIQQLDKSIDDLNQNSKDKLLMVVVLPLCAIILIVLFAIPYLYKNDVDLIKRFFDEKLILQVFTVFIIVITILLLGVADKIKGETLGTLLGGISVYVLQTALGNQTRSGK